MADESNPPLVVNMPAAPYLNPVLNVVALCGVTSVAACQIFIDLEGLDTSLDVFANLNGASDVTQLAERMASRGATVGRAILGTKQIKKIQALVHWVKGHHERNLDMVPEMWTQGEDINTIHCKEAKHNLEKIDTDLIDPGRCQTDVGWDAWQIAFFNKLIATMGAAMVPVAYVVCPDVGSDYEFEDDKARPMYQMPLSGENYTRDNKLVHNMLKVACIESDTWTWIQDHN